MTVALSDAARLRMVDGRIVELTGERFHLYTAVPGDRQTRVVFKDGVKHGYAAALVHAERFLALMENPVPCSNTHPHGIHAWTRDGMDIGCHGAERDLTGQEETR